MYREVTMIEVKEVLRLRREGVPTKRLAAQLGLDPKTVRRYLGAATAAGVRSTVGCPRMRTCARCCSPSNRLADGRAVTAGRSVRRSARRFAAGSPTGSG